MRPAVAILLLLAACSPGGLGLSGTGGGPPAADGSRRGESGMVVGDRLMASGEYELALKAYLRAAADEGMTSDVLASIGSANLALGRLNQAELALRRAVDEDPENIPALNNLGVVLMNEDKPGEARVFFQRAYALDSGATDSIRENLRLAIAQSEGTVYSAPVEGKSPSAVVREQDGSTNLVTLSDL
ncbi:tetratricopeptide repeat protein [Neotabrizicola shimadae]|uniref:Tetratricopeptide repeat protein n=1 Tax=Neotabrizicola shimadae TaxID=2807096 RepID=A0A8G1EDM4_9RHOB|nr:tetratricopeptide repeat protein [Neotabrizicola shimadae]QYZ71682.1 tetratricopeptide repeat protein [Neotabrizicola shimadae]